MYRILISIRGKFKGKFANVRFAREKCRRLIDDPPSLLPVKFRGEPVLTPFAAVRRFGRGLGGITRRSALEGKVLMQC